MKALPIAMIAGLISTSLALAQKPTKPAPPQEQHPARDPAAIAVSIDRAIDRRMSEAKLASSPRSDDGEFLRRVYLDLTGRIPTWERAKAFLDASDSDKRRKLIDELLASEDFGRHLADIWRPILAPRDPANTKPQVDRFSPWLAGEFNRNRGWNRLAGDLLGVVGDVKDRPETSFLMANAENAQPKASSLAAATGTAFLGIQLQCAECHDHPFAPWKQADFWGLAAYFGKVRNTGVKGPPWILTEDADPKPLAVRNGGVERPVMRTGGAIVIPSAGGNKGAGTVVPAKLLEGQPSKLDDSTPFRPQLVNWLVAGENPYFARSFVNRAWTQLFGRGLVHPVDQMHASNAGLHPDVLELLAREFVAGEFDIKHLFRSITQSAAYQRTSQPSKGNEADREFWSHMAIKPIGPESLFDSLQVVYMDRNGKPSPGKPIKPAAGKPQKPDGEKRYPPKDPREEFLQFFRGHGGGDNELTHGIPQFLRRMNGDEFNAPSPLVERLAAENADSDRAIETLYLATLARRPTAEERAIMTKYLTGRSSKAKGFAGVLWVLLNSGEFILNR